MMDQISITFNKNPAASRLFLEINMRRKKKRRVKNSEAEIFVKAAIEYPAYISGCDVRFIS